MYSLRRPTPEGIQLQLSKRADSMLSYYAVGSTLNDSIPTGWPINHHKVQLGHGDALWEAAKLSLIVFDV